MRRADRLFQIIQFLRTRRITTAKWLAEALEVSERTIYRDIADLMVSGVPIDGEAGVGYVLRHGFDLPPLMFTSEEITALTLGARIVQSWADPALASAAKQALDKIETVLPDALKHEINKTPLFSPMTRLSKFESNNLAALREAIKQQHKSLITYHREDGEPSERVIWPLGLFFWGNVWTLAAWCEKRDAYRNFRVDRIQRISCSADCFPFMQDRSLSDYIDKARENAL